MGCADSNPTPNPTPINICNPAGDLLNDLYDVPNSCFFTTEIGKFCEGSEQMCPGEAQGNAEWVRIGGGAGCGVCSASRIIVKAK